MKVKVAPKVVEDGVVEYDEPGTFTGFPQSITATAFK